VGRADGAGRRRELIGVAATLVVLTAVLAGCKTAPPPPTVIEASLQGSPQLNPSVSQRPSPLLLRVYELKSPTAFNQADFMSMYQSDQAALASDLVARDEVMLQPGETRPYKKQLAPETRFIGVIAAYRDLEQATWRVVVPVQVGKTQKLTIRADRLAVSVTP
jgi:type VI secretion system protein VasD